MDINSLANLQQAEFEGEEELVESEKPEKDTQADSPPGNKPAEAPVSSTEGQEEAPKEDAKLEVYTAFHEHPRWKAREEELRQLREKVEEYEEFKSRVDPLLEKLEKPQEGKPEWFTNLYGDDDNAWKQYQASSEETQRNFEKRIFDKLKPYLETLEATKQESETQKWANEQWSKLGEDPEVQKELRNMGLTLDKVQGEISEVMTKFKPSDEEGNISLRGSYEIWKSTKKPESKPDPIVAEKKKLGAITKPKESEGKKYMTSADFKGKSLADLLEE